MRYSIVMPVFNREDLTRHCLATLRPTLAGAGDGEIIVVDNGSRPETAAVLAEFPWVRVIRNAENRGFAAACNAGARAASGRYIIHLNNDTVALDGWLTRLLARLEEPGVGIAGARLLFPNDTIQHAGVLLAPFRLGPDGIGPFHHLWTERGNLPAALVPRDFEVVTGACMATPRDLFLELGGFDETFWNGNEDVDYCLKVRARGLRVTYEPTAVLYHYESQSGAQRKRRLMHNIRELGARWATRVAPDHNRCADLTRTIRREQFVHHRRMFYVVALPETTAFVHGPAPTDAQEFLRTVRGGGIVPSHVIWAAAGPAPAGTVAATEPLAAARAATEVRADRYVAFLDTRVALERDWLLDSVDTVEFARDIAASTVLPPALENSWAPATADGQCTLVKLAAIPQHLRIDSSFESVGGAVADWLGRTVQTGRAVRRTHRPTATVASSPPDRVFEQRHGMQPADAIRPDPERMEALSRLPAAETTFASIVMLSWNAPEFTELAVQSIRAHTTVPHEIIIIDNGSGPDTIARLGALRDVRIIYNAQNTGFAHGCNQGLAAATGTHVVLLNNDVVVTAGWLDALLAAHRRDPAIGISAPRSNYVAGHQQVHDAVYPDLDAMHVYARGRSERLAGRTYHTDRVIGFCMCLSRSVVDEVGGIDTRYGVGNFEDDDYCLRVRAAGYEIVVCEDSFIHHFGNVTFKANNVDWTSQMQKNWLVFFKRWNLPDANPANGYDPRPAIRRGFVRERDYVALPGDTVAAAAGAEGVAEPLVRAYALAIVATVRDENDWSRIAPVISSYARALDARDAVVFAVGALGELDAQTLGKRIERALHKAGVDPERSADIEVSDVADVPAWLARFGGARCFAVAEEPEFAGLEALPERSRSGILRLVRGAARGSDAARAAAAVS
jgi:GT2 family glycosyltransferase